MASLLKARTLFRRGVPVLTPLVRSGMRFLRAWNFAAAPTGRALRWLVGSHELSYGYDLRPTSRLYLIDTIARIFGRTFPEIEALYREVEDDPELRAAIEERIRSTPERYFVQRPVKYGGKRIAWYILVRLLKPRLVVESGIDRGLGTALIARALILNGREGSPGRVLGLDITPFAGQLIPPDYLAVAGIVRGDSLETLAALDGTLDLLIHDSHVHETEEYRIALEKLSPDGMIVAVESAYTTALFDFARENGLEFWFWKEMSADHPYEGAGLGFVRKAGRKDEF